jgi:hypothetical protein
MDAEAIEFSKWLLEKFIEFQRKMNYPVSIADFARDVGVMPSIMRQYLRGVRVPSENSALILSTKLGPDIFNVLHMTVPEPEIQLIYMKWPSLSNENKHKIMEILLSEESAS